MNMQFSFQSRPTDTKPVTPARDYNATAQLSSFMNIQASGSKPNLDEGFGSHGSALDQNYRTYANLPQATSRPLVSPPPSSDLKASAYFNVSLPRPTATFPSSLGTFNSPPVSPTSFGGPTGKLNLRGDVRSPAQLSQDSLRVPFQSYPSSSGTKTGGLTRADKFGHMPLNLASEFELPQVPDSPSMNFQNSFGNLQVGDRIADATLSPQISVQGGSLFRPLGRQQFPNGTLNGSLSANQHISTSSQQSGEYMNLQRQGNVDVSTKIRPPGGKEVEYVNMAKFQLVPINPTPYATSKVDLNKQDSTYSMARIASPQGASSTGGVALIENQSNVNRELEVVISCLSHENEVVRLNACAYLQHLTFQNATVKDKTRELNGISAILAIIRNGSAVLHLHALHVLQNLSCGDNMQIKREILYMGGISVIANHLVQSQTSAQMQEACTAILWNVSACPDSFSDMLTIALHPLLERVIYPLSGGMQKADDGTWVTTSEQVYWCALLQNATGVLRNLSAVNGQCRNRLRHCDGLVDSLFVILKAAIGQPDIDNKCVENCVCTLRNLCYACQEEVDPNYLLRREYSRQSYSQPNSKSKFHLTNCASDGSDTSRQSSQRDMSNKPKLNSQVDQEKGDFENEKRATLQAPPIHGNIPQGVHLLWHVESVPYYLAVLKDSCNPDTIEATAGIIQNLVACDWQPSLDIRTEIRKLRGLPLLVQLLTTECDPVVCTSATALRNLAVDEKNKELIGMYTVPTLVQCLPSGPLSESQENTLPPVPPLPATPDVNNDCLSLETIASLLALIYTVIKSSTAFMTKFVEESGELRCMYIHRSNRFVNLKALEEWDKDRVQRFARHILMTLWWDEELRARFHQTGWAERDFCVDGTHSMPKTGGVKKGSNGSGGLTSICGCTGERSRGGTQASMTKTSMKKGTMSNQATLNGSRTVTLQRPNEVFIGGAGGTVNGAYENQSEYTVGTVQRGPRDISSPINNASNGRISGRGQTAESGSLSVKFNGGIGMNANFGIQGQAGGTSRTSGPSVATPTSSSVVWHNPQPREQLANTGQIYDPMAWGNATMDQHPSRVFSPSSQHSGHFINKSTTPNRVSANVDQPDSRVIDMPLEELIRQGYTVDMRNTPVENGMNSRHRDNDGPQYAQVQGRVSRASANNTKAPGNGGLQFQYDGSFRPSAGFSGKLQVNENSKTNSWV